jgi:hypothetical protein
VCELRAHRSFGRYLRQRKGGKLESDKAKLAREAKIDAKHLMSTSDGYLRAEDVVLGYEQRHEIERVNRDLEHTVDVRPVYHRREDRIRSLTAPWLARALAHPPDRNPDPADLASGHEDRAAIVGGVPAQPVRHRDLDQPRQ